MKYNTRRNKRGFTLLEMLLVIVIVSTIILMSINYMAQKAESMRIDNTVLKMQYVLNAGLAYYVASVDGKTSGGQWPGNNDEFYQLNGTGSNPLQPNYLGASPILDMTGKAMSFTHVSHSGVFGPPNTFQVMVCVPGDIIKSTLNAKLIAAKLPLGYTVSGGPLNCPTILAVGYVLIPGQSINDAMAVQYAGVYHPGACVPVPMCPNTTTSSGTIVTMTPKVFVVPLSVSGFNDTGSGSTHIYPISSFTAYAKGPSTAPGACNNSVGTQPSCSGGNDNNLYWRVCLQLITERGNVQQSGSTDWAKNVTLSAFTRCEILNEPSGSDFTVYGN